MKSFVLYLLIVLLTLSCRKEDPPVTADTPQGIATLDLNGNRYPIDNTEVIRTTRSGKIYLTVVITGTDRSEVQVRDLETNAKTYRILDNSNLRYVGATRIAYQTHYGELRVSDVSTDKDGKYIISGSFNFKASSVVASDTVDVTSGFINGMRER